MHKTNTTQQFSKTKGQKPIQEYTVLIASVSCRKESDPDSEGGGGGGGGEVIISLN